jgi:PAS domain S-box-containing protein
MIQPIKDETKIILDSIADGVFTVDSANKITSFNRAAVEITGINREEATGRYCWEVFKASICEKHCCLRDTMQTGRSYINQPVFIVNADGRRIPVSISTALLKDRKGTVIGGVETFRDLSVEEALRKELSGSQSFQDIISKNKEMQHLFGMLELISEGDTTVLIEGESGTGKELFAKAIHSLSYRKEGPLITVNCGSLPDTRFGPLVHARLGIAEENSGKLVTLVRKEAKQLAEEKNLDFILTEPGLERYSLSYEGFTYLSLLKRMGKISSFNYIIIWG